MALKPRFASASALSGHLRLGPAGRAGPGIFLPGSLHGSVLQCNQKAVGALLLLFPAKVCKFSLGKAVPEPLFLLEPQLRAPTQRAQAPRTGVGCSARASCCLHDSRHATPHAAAACLRDAQGAPGSAFPWLNPCPSSSSSRWAES